MQANLEFNKVKIRICSKLVEDKAKDNLIGTSLIKRLFDKEITPESDESLVIIISVNISHYFVLLLCKGSIRQF